MGSLTAQGSSLENCRPKGLGGSNPSPSAIWKRVREAYCAWLLTRCGNPPQVRILPLPFSHGCAPELDHCPRHRTGPQGAERCRYTSEALCGSLCLWQAVWPCTVSATPGRINAVAGVPSAGEASGGSSSPNPVMASGSATARRTKAK